MWSVGHPATAADAAERVGGAGRRVEHRAVRACRSRPAADRHRLLARRVDQRRGERHEVEEVVGVQVREHDGVDVHVVHPPAELAERAVAAVQQQRRGALLDQIRAAGAPRVLPRGRLAQDGDAHSAPSGDGVTIRRAVARLRRSAGARAWRRPGGLRASPRDAPRAAQAGRRGAGPPRPRARQGARGARPLGARGGGDRPGRRPARRVGGRRDGRGRAGGPRRRRAPVARAAHGARRLVGGPAARRGAPRPRRARRPDAGAQTDVGAAAADARAGARAPGPRGRPRSSPAIAPLGRWVRLALRAACPRTCTAARARSWPSAAATAPGRPARRHAPGDRRPRDA